jgi:hypothetical protein
MAINTLAALLSQPYDCLLLVHPYIQILEKLSIEVQESGVSHLNISKELSTSLMTVSASELSRFSQKWLIDTLATFQNGPVLCTCPDLLFDPSLKIDPLSLIRQAARIKQLIVLWPGEYSANTLSYAAPEHHHFRTWKITDSLLRQPIMLIHQISASQGA